MADANTRCHVRRNCRRVIEAADVREHTPRCHDRHRLLLRESLAAIRSGRGAEELANRKLAQLSDITLRLLEREEPQWSTQQQHLLGIELVRHW